MLFHTHLLTVTADTHRKTSGIMDKHNGGKSSNALCLCHLFIFHNVSTYTVPKLTQLPGWVCMWLVTELMFLRTWSNLQAQVCLDSTGMRSSICRIPHPPPTHPRFTVSIMAATSEEYKITTKTLLKYIGFEDKCIYNLGCIISWLYLFMLFY